MSTLGTMIADIVEDLDRGSEYESRVQKAIVRSIIFYKAQRFHFNTGRSTVLVSAERTSLSADMLITDQMILQVDGVALRNLQPRTSKWIDSHKTDETYTGEPVYYSIEDRQLRLFPPPDQSYSIEMHGLFDYTGISASTSDSTTSNVWMSRDGGYDLIRQRAMAEVLAVYVKGNEAVEQAQTMRTLEGETFEALKKRFNDGHSEAEVRPCM